MCKNILFGAMEYLNYFSLIYWGIKLFLRKYNVETGRKGWVDNLIIIAVSAPVVWLCVKNYRFAVYSNMVTYILVIYIYLYVEISSKRRVEKLFTLVVIYINSMRLIDLLVVAVICEVNRVSRQDSLDFIHMGIPRSLFIFILIIIYFFIFYKISNGKLYEYLYENDFYRYFVSIYSFLGIICFCRVYRFGYEERLIQYWFFYLLFVFIVCGVFVFYLLRIKGEEQNRILNMRNNLMKAHYLELQKAYDENKILYHDFKNHILVLDQLIREQKNEEAIEYIESCVEMTSCLVNSVQSGCEIIDIIINRKIMEARDKEIKFFYHVEYIGQIAINDIDLCALLANLLDNAVEACEAVPDKKAWINLKILRKNDLLLIQLENSLSTNKSSKKHFFISDKIDKKLHGIGMKSIEKVIEKYDGYMEYKVSDKFEIFIYLSICE